MSHDRAFTSSASASPAASSSSSLLKDVERFAFIGVRCVVREASRTPGYARRAASDVRDAWRESGAPAPSASQPFDAPDGASSPSRPPF